MAASPSPPYFLPSRNFTLTPSLELTNLGAFTRDFYRLHLHRQILAGTKRPLLLPLTLMGPMVIPTIYFAIDHTRRPWLYTARWLVLAVIVWMCVDELMHGSSYNMAAAYAVGLVQSWGIIWSATLLVWMRPQFEAERVERRRRLGRSRSESGTGNGHVNGGTQSSSEKVPNGKVAVDLSQAPDEDVARNLADGWEYYWQKFPADAPFLTRLDWALDLVINMRGTGWNHAASTIPSFALPSKPLSSSPVDLRSMPLSTRFGYRRFTTSASFLRSCALLIARDYIALDIVATLMMKDPYFILGPEYNPSSPANSLPPLLAKMAHISWFLVFSWRSLASFVGIFCGLHIIFTTFQLLCHFCLSPILGTRSELWNYPSVNGGFVDNVLDKGLVGFWGAWWHQTFRVAFSAPSMWAARNGYIDLRTEKGKVVASMAAFALSGFLHSLGSITCVPDTKPWLPPAFFMMSCFGTLLQEALGQHLFGKRSAATTSKHQGMIKYAKWAYNFGFAFVFMHNTQFFFIDDVSRSALWLFEPVPISFVRMLGYGKPGDSWWRWDVGQWPFLFAGKRWYEVGIAV